MSRIFDQPIEEIKPTPGKPGSSNVEFVDRVGNKQTVECDNDWAASVGVNRRTSMVVGIDVSKLPRKRKRRSTE